MPFAGADLGLAWQASTYLEFVHAGSRMLASYSIEELTAIRRFVEDALDLQQRMTAKLLERKGRKLRVSSPMFPVCELPVKPRFWRRISR
jgi:hypothetical protein